MPPTSPQREHAEFHLLNRREDIERAENALLDALERRGYPKAARYAVRLAIEEALVNAFRHGHKGLAADLTVRFAYELSPAGLTMEVEDQGPGFDPSKVKDPTLDENLEVPSGRGLLLMRAYMTSIDYLGRGNIVRMTYQPPPATPG